MLQVDWLHHVHLFLAICSTMRYRSCAISVERNHKNEGKRWTAHWRTDTPWPWHLFQVSRPGRPPQQPVDCHSTRVVLLPPRPGRKLVVNIVDNFYGGSFLTTYLFLTTLFIFDHLIYFLTTVFIFWPPSLLFWQWLGHGTAVFVSWFDVEDQQRQQDRAGRTKWCR